MNESSILLIPASIIVCYVIWFYRRSASMLQQWGASNGFTLLHSASRNFRRGPLLWSSSKHQAVYFVRVRDQEGRERSGWLCLGGYWAGLFKYEATMKWEGE
jgi:hypothetical protein